MGALETLLETSIPTLSLSGSSLPSPMLFERPMNQSLEQKTSPYFSSALSGWEAEVEEQREPFQRLPHHQSHLLAAPLPSLILSEPPSLL